jgi:hypothetical protein
MRGGRATAPDSCCAASRALRPGRLTPGIMSRMVSRTARNPAHVTHTTPRRSGKRDLGSAGYGCAPVNRRRRPVTDGGVGARLVGSLMDLALDNGPRVRQSARRAIAMTTRVRGKARAQSAQAVVRCVGNHAAFRWRAQACAFHLLLTFLLTCRLPWRASRSFRARSSCRSWRSSC